MGRREGYVPVGNGLHLYWRMDGEGSDVVVVPPACWEAEEMQPLADGRTMLFYDPRNRGQSDAIDDPEQIGMEHDVRDLDLLRQHLGMEQISLIGHSYLGAFAALYAMTYPKRVDRLMILCSIAPCRNPYHNTTSPQGQARQAKMTARLDQTALKRLEELRQAGLNISDPEVYCREWNKAYRPSQLARPESLASMRSDPCAFPNEWEQHLSPRLGHMWAALGDWDWRSQLASLEVPTLVVHGVEDLIPLEASREWAAALPNARLLLIPDVGHMPAIEAPEVFFPAADRFLRGAWPEQAEMVTNAS